MVSEVKLILFFKYVRYLKSKGSEPVMKHVPVMKQRSKFHLKVSLELTVSKLELFHNWFIYLISYFRLRVHVQCALSTDAHTYEVYWTRV